MNIETTIGSVEIDVWGRSAEVFLDKSTYDLTAFRDAVAAALEAGNSEGAVEFSGRGYTWRITETDWMEHTADDGSSDIACYADYTRRMRAGCSADALSGSELQREDARTQLLQRIAYACTGSDQTEAQFRSAVKREYPDLKLNRDEWARIMRFRYGVLERMGR